MWSWPSQYVVVRDLAIWVLRYGHCAGMMGQGPIAGAASSAQVADASWICALHAKVAELADAPDLGSGSRKAMGVRVPPFALHVRL